MEVKFDFTSRSNIPNRQKGFDSFINNVKKEIDYNLEVLAQTSPTKEDIDRMVEKFKQEVIKDLHGATLVVHTLADFSDYCKNSNDSELKKLYNQYSVIEKYLNDNSHSKDKIDISNVFIDDSIDGSNDNSKDSTIPHEIVPLDIENISTLEDYYEQLIALLILLTNASMFGVPYQSKIEKFQNQSKGFLNPSSKQRIVSEIDYSISDIMELIKLSEGSNNYFDQRQKKILKVLQELCNQYKEIPKEVIDMFKIMDKSKEYNSHTLSSNTSKSDGGNNPLEKEYDSFDIQLIESLEEEKKASKNPDFRDPLPDSERKAYIIKLRHLKDNLDQIKKDRLHNYIIRKRLIDLIESVKNDPQYSFDIQIDSSKEVNYTYGYSSFHTVLSLDDISLEFIGRTEFRDDMTKEGPSEHNSNQPGKTTYNLNKFFELENPTDDEKVNRLLLAIYCNFLNSMSNASIKNKTNKNEKQVDLAKLAKSQIRIKDNITEVIKSSASNKSTFISIPFKEYIERLLEYECAKAYEVQPNHSDEPDTLIIKQKTKKDALLARFRNRVGISALAHMVVDKYVELCQQAASELYDTVDSKEGIDKYVELCMKAASGLYDTVDSKEGIDKKATTDLKEASSLINPEPINSKFYPQGNFQSSDNKASSSPENKKDRE